MYERMLTKYYDEIFRYCYHHVGSREMAKALELLEKEVNADEAQESER